MLSRFPNFHPRTGYEGPALAALPMERKTAPNVQEAGWATGPVLAGAENLAPTLGFNLQTVWTISSHYTHVMKV